MAEEATKTAAGAAAAAAAAAARGAVDVCLSGGAFGGFSFSLKIDSPWLAAGIAIGTFYIANKALSERAIRKALQQQTSSTANADPEVTSISTGSILVQLQCHTEESFLRFVDDIDSKKAKYRLEEELARVGFREEIRLTVENKEELKIFIREEMKLYTIEVNHSMCKLPERYDSIQPLGYDTHGQLCAATDKQTQDSVVIQNLASARKFYVHERLRDSDIDIKIDLSSLSPGWLIRPPEPPDQLKKIFNVLGTPEKALIEKCSIAAQKYLSDSPLKEKRDLSECLQPSNVSPGFVAFLERIPVMDPAEALRDPYLEGYHDPDPDDEPFSANGEFA